MPDAPVPDAPADALVAWATAGGLRMHSSLVVTSGAMRGRALLATEPIPKGTELLRVPYDLLLTSKDTPRDFGDLGQTNRLAVALLMERRQPARWAHPLAMLPESFDTPLYHTPDQLAWLQGSPLVAWSHGREQAMLRSLGSIQDRWTTSAAVQSTGAVAEGDAGALGIDELRWALSVAWSRSFMVRLQVGAPKTASLVPMGDLINHAEDVLANTASRSEPEGSAFVFYADRPIARGEECTTSYGHVGEPSNAVLMLDYGFCLPYSSHDEVSVDLSPPADADPMQAAWLQRLGLTDHAARTSLTLLDRRSGAPQTSLSPEVLVTLRVRALEPNLLRSASPQQLMQPLQPAAAEAHALGLLAEALRSRLTEYARPFAADERELRALIALAGGMAGAAGSAGAAGAVGAADGDAGDGAVVAARRQCALSLVVAERRVLHHWLGLVTDLEEQLRPPNPLSPSPSPSPSPSRSPSPSPTASPSSPVLHSYLSDGTPWDPLVNNTDSGIGAEVHLRDAPTRCTLEVRALRSLLCRLLGRLHCSLRRTLRFTLRRTFRCTPRCSAPPR